MSSPQSILSTPSPGIPQKTNTFAPTTEIPDEDSTPSPSVTQEWPTTTPEATLPIDIAIDSMSIELMTNGDCRFPCIFGFMSGETTVKSLHIFQSRFNTISELTTSSDSGTASFTVPQGEHDLVFILGYFQKNNLIDKFVINAYSVNDIRGNTSQQGHDPHVGNAFDAFSGNRVFQYFLPINIVTTYGRPFNVLVGGFYDDRQPADKTDWKLSVVLDYSNQGFVLEYLIFGKPDDQYLTLCPSDAKFINGWFVYHRNGEIANIIGTNGKSMGGINPLNLSWFKPIDTATSMTIDDFYNSFNEPKADGCIRTPIDIWKP